MNDIGLVIIQYIIVLILFVIIIYLFRQNISINKEKRIARYSIESINRSELSILDKLTNYYVNLIKRLRKYVSKVSFFKRKSKKYEKYILISSSNNVKAIDYITNKILIGIIFVMLTIFSLVLQTKLITIWELIIDFAIGYYIFDIYLWYVNKKRRKLIENEMLRAIIIMNNSFKAGKSTLQALKIASEELEDPIKSEFKKLYDDMNFGLSIDTVFERFAKRVDIAEVKYLSSSLTILNKTGGNIVQVFNSIERTLFDKKKLQEELKNLTLSSNMVVKILIAVPIIFVALIYLLSPTYFNPFFESILGYMLLLIMILLFSIYVWFLQKIMKVDI